MDVDEEEGPKRRGGRKRTLRKRAQLGLAEVEMGDAEVWARSLFPCCCC